MAKILLGAVVLVVALVVLVWVANRTASANIGVKDGRLLPCPDRPNCVCSQDPADQGHFVEPLTLSTSPDDALGRIKEHVGKLPRTRLVEERPGYLHYTFTSALLRFSDDVEFLTDETGQVIHMRSASRLGYSDLGVNRERIEGIRKGVSR